MVGFRAVIDAVSKRQIPVVGHNTLLDLAHIYAKFIGPMPDDIATFKSRFHEAFPTVYDTKQLAQTIPSLQVRPKLLVLVAKRRPQTQQ